jgi:hypothetical protein
VECGGFLISRAPARNLVRQGRQLTNRVWRIQENADLLLPLAEKRMAGIGQPAVLRPASPLGSANGENFLDHLCREGFLLEPRELLFSNSARSQNVGFRCLEERSSDACRASHHDASDFPPKHRFDQPYGLSVLLALPEVRCVEGLNSTVHATATFDVLRYEYPAFPVRARVSSRGGIGSEERLLFIDHERTPKRWKGTLRTIDTFAHLAAHADGGCKRWIMNVQSS